MSQSVGAPFSAEIMLRCGVPPHMSMSPFGGTDALATYSVAAPAPAGRAAAAGCALPAGVGAGAGGRCGLFWASNSGMATAPTAAVPSAPKVIRRDSRVRNRCVGWNGCFMDTFPS
jgi:hypothetical protein